MEILCLFNTFAHVQVCAIVAQAFGSKIEEQ